MIIDLSTLESTITIGTHDGVFHIDDVVSTAILKLAFYDQETTVVRTRDGALLNMLNFVVGFDSNFIRSFKSQKFDHYVLGLVPLVTSFTSTGLVWEYYGEEAIKNVAEKNHMVLDDEHINIVKETIDRKIIVPVDTEANGNKVTNHAFSFVSTFLPSWMDEPDYDEAFEKVLSISKEILEKLIKSKIIEIFTNQELEDRLKVASDGILEIPNPNFQWQEAVIKFNKTHSQKVNFVIFPIPSIGWIAQCVPVSLKKLNKWRVSFPEELQNVHGIRSKSNSFAVASTKDAIVKMCNLATSSKKILL